MENLATAFPQVDNILQCCSGLSALTRFLIITADVTSRDNPLVLSYSKISPSSASLSSQTTLKWSSARRRVQSQEAEEVFRIFNKRKKIYNFSQIM